MNRLPLLRRHGFLLAVLTGLALLATWPLITRVGTHVPGSDTWAYDEYTFIWSMWWFKYSLLDLQSSIFFSQYIFYPLGMELILYSYNLLAAILALPLGLAANWPLAANGTLYFSIIASGYGAYLLAVWALRTDSGYRILDIGRRKPNTQYLISTIQYSALLAALIYAFASNRLIYLAMGHYNIQSWQFLPFFVLYILRLMQRSTRKNALMAGLFGALNLLVDMQFGVFMAFLGGCLLLTKPLRGLLAGGGAARRWAALAGAGITAILLTLPYFGETVKSFRHADFLLSGWGDALKLSADLLGWLTPTALHPIWGVADWPAHLRAVQEGTAPFRDVNTVFLGYATLALALIGAAAAWQRVKGWIWAAGLSALFTLGPLLQIGGRISYNFDGLETGVPLPFLLLHYLPFVQGNRTANRWSIVLMLALAVLVAYGAAALFGWMRAQRRGAAIPIGTILLAGALLFEHAAIPLPLTDARIPPAIEELAAQPPGAVLQIPMGWRNSFGVLGTERTQAQYYMSAHEKPFIGGNTSRNPAIKFAYFARLPLVAAITQTEAGQTPDPALLDAARAQAADLITLWGIRYLLTLPPVPGRLPYADTWQASQQLALDLIPHSPAPIIAAEGIEVWAVQPGAPLPLELDFGGAATDLWRAEGWGDDEADVGGASGVWATARRAHVLFRSEDDRPRTLSLRAAPFDWPGAPPQTMTLLLGDEEIGAATLAPGWAEYTFAITPQAGINHLRLEFSRADSPRSMLGQAQIGATGVQSPVNIDIHAFEQAFITLTDAGGNQTDASFGRRGINVTTLDPATGAVLAAAGFDAVANAFEVESLVAYLNKLPAGQIVLIATRENAGPFISPDLMAALNRLGSGLTDPAQLSGQTYALAGVVGAAPGSASETLDPADAFLRIAGDYRSLAAAFDWLKIND
ncbi:MAG: hypothetical protein HUU23_05640 [Caldilineales bacterium]|nr:hypothetical protein [Caldilineales bacterium]